jgi:hypothetical protein
MARAKMGVILSHWYQLIEGLQASPKEFYASVEEAIKARSIPDTKTIRVDWPEAGPFSPKREYLRVIRKEHTFDICAAPFAKGFFVSWWLAEQPSGCLFFFSDVPVLGAIVERFVRPQTYYRIDTALMFQESIRRAVLDVVDGLTQAKGLRALTELERKPILREFFQR